VVGAAKAIFGKEEMKIIVGCEYSQVVTKAFRKLGHKAYSCDLLPTEGNPAWHFQEDIFGVLERERFDVGIFHPPCTYLCNSGVRWLWNKDGSKNLERWEKMRQGAEFFKRLLNANLPSVGAENPIMHKYAREIIGVPYTQVIQPFQYGHGEQKATCLWLRGLPKLEPTNIVSGREQRIWKLPPGVDRWKERSRTFQGVAEAMASQWGGMATSQLPASPLYQAAFSF
jgi:hypothetical protein